MTRRQQLARSGRYLAPPTTTAGLVTSQPMVDALDIPAGMNPTGLELIRPDDDPNTGLVAEDLGVIMPRKGTSFLVMSTGPSGGDELALAEPGLDYSPLGEGGDLVRLRFRVDVPPQSNRMSLDYNFLSAEAPEFTGSTYNDTFTVRITDKLGIRREATTVSVQHSDFHYVSETTVGHYSYMLYVFDATGINTTFNKSGMMKMDAGTTGFQRLDIPIDSAGQVEIELEIRDVGDGIGDSTIVVDNIGFSAVEIVDPNTRDAATTLIDGSGRVIYPDPGLPEPNLPEALVTRGEPVHSVAADGVTQVLLRSNVPGPGAVTFSLTSLLTEDGSLSTNDATLNWDNEVTVQAELFNGKYYAFALYRGPADFFYVPEPPDTTDYTSKRERTATLSMSFQPEAGTTNAPFTHNFTINVVRPPVLVVPDIWSGCMDWERDNSFGAPVPQESGDPRTAFTVTCADYEATNSRSFAANSHVVREYIDQVLDLLRAPGVAATQLDVVGHGVGGLLARKHIDSSDYLRPDNFNEGSVNRLITMNTPHLGSRMAEEIVRFRNALTAGELVEVNRDLEFQNIRINCVNGVGDCMIEQLTPTSQQINDIGQNVVGPRNVPYHVLYSTYGRSILRDKVLGNYTNLPVRLKSLYVYMENQHPRTAGLSEAERKNLIAGPGSYIFCSEAPNTTLDNHDLFLTMHEQMGGVAPEFTSEFATFYDEADDETNFSEHFNISNDIIHTLPPEPPEPPEPPAPPDTAFSLVELLNFSVSDPRFTTSLPAPADVLTVNNCPMVNQLPPLAPLAPAPALVPGSIAITVLSPDPGENVTPGQEVILLIQPTGATPESVLITGLGSSVVVKYPFKAVLKVPASAIGTVSLRATAFYSDSSMAFADRFTLDVEVPATLTSITVLNGDIVLPGPGRTRQLRAFGTYSDGVRRDITSSSLGTRYKISSLSPTLVASISADGLLTAMGPGVATIAVSNGSTVITSINLKVGDPHPPVAVCHSPTTCNDPGMCSADITTLGAGSHAPNGDPVSITQSPAGPYAVGEHTVSVLVYAGAQSAQCTSQLAVLDCEAPSLTCPADFSAECAGPGGTCIQPPPAVASDNCSVTMNEPAGGYLPPGTHQLTYAASDPSGNNTTCTTTVNIVDTTPPQVLVTSPEPMWPANHRYKTVSLNDCNLAVEDACGGPLTPGTYQAEITCVTSDEPDDAAGPGDGNTVDDIIILNDTTVRLRAERHKANDGRVYNIHFRVRDAANNTKDGVCSVAVPHHNNSPAGDSGIANSVCH